MSDERGTIFISPRVNQIRLNFPAHAPDQEGVEPEKCAHTQNSRSFQNVEHRPISLEGEVTLDPTPQHNHLHVKRRVFFEFGEQRYFPCSRIASWQRAQRLR